MIQKNIVEKIVEQHIADTDYYLVETVITPNNHISIEIDSFEGVSIDYCVELSRYIESQLDRDAEDYELEVGSAGLTSPFKVKKQYEKNIGNEVEVLTKDGKKLSGVLIIVDEETFTIEIEKQIKPEGAKRKITVKEEINFPYDGIKTIKYIFRFK